MSTHAHAHTHSSKVPRNGAGLLQHKGLTSLLDAYRHDSDLYELSKLSHVSNTAYKRKAKNTIALSDECQNAHPPIIFRVQTHSSGSSQACLAALCRGIVLFSMRPATNPNAYFITYVKYVQDQICKKQKQTKRQNVTEILVFILALLFSYFSKTKCMY